MKKPIPARRQRRGNRLLAEHIHDPYWSGLKLRRDTLCPECGAAFRNGRWVWPKVQTEWPAKALCPACRRIEDGYPAGEILLDGSFVAAHREEIMNLARSVERSENAEHPLHRIMDLHVDDDMLTITTTDIHLPRRIGHALEHAWDGALSTHYDEEGHFARVIWHRDN